MYNADEHIVRRAQALKSTGFGCELQQIRLGLGPCISGEHHYLSIENPPFHQRIVDAVCQFPQLSPASPTGTKETRGGIGILVTVSETRCHTEVQTEEIIERIL